jgi:hypothetical protein
MPMYRGSNGHTHTLGVDQWLCIQSSDNGEAMRDLDSSSFNQPQWGRMWWRSNYISRRSLSYLLSISSHSYALTHTHTHTCTPCYRVIQTSVVIFWMVEMELYQWMPMPAPHCQSLQVLCYTKKYNVNHTIMDKRMDWWVWQEKILCCAI